MREEWKTVAKAVREKWLTVTAQEAALRPRAHGARTLRADRHGERL